LVTRGLNKFVIKQLEEELRVNYARMKNLGQEPGMREDILIAKNKFDDCERFLRQYKKIK
jgi:hypothetical protein